MYYYFKKVFPHSELPFFPLSKSIISFSCLSLLIINFVSWLSDSWCWYFCDKRRCRGEGGVQIVSDIWTIKVVSTVHMTVNHESIIQANKCSYYVFTLVFTFLYNHQRWSDNEGRWIHPLKETRVAWKIIFLAWTQ